MESHDPATIQPYSQANHTRTIVLSLLLSLQPQQHASGWLATQIVPKGTGMATAGTCKHTGTGQSGAQPSRAGPWHRRRPAGMQQQVSACTYTRPCVPPAWGCQVQSGRSWGKEGKSPNFAAREGSFDSPRPARNCQLRFAGKIRIVAYGAWGEQVHPPGRLPAKAQAHLDQVLQGGGGPWLVGHGGCMP